MPRPFARAAHIPGQMNKTEAAYAALLEQRKMAGEILDYKFESYTLKLGKDCRYTPDFMVLRPDGVMEFHEVKGFWRDDAKAKLRIAAAHFPHPFYSIEYKRKEWITTQYSNPEQ